MACGLSWAAFALAQEAAPLRSAVVLQVGDELHGTRNTSGQPASYYVIKAWN